MPARLAPVAVALALLLGAGCGPPKLDESRTYSIPALNAEGIDLPAVSKAQTLTVTFTASAEVLVLVFKEADAKGESGMLNAEPNKALAQQKGKEGTLTAAVPENTATRVVVRALTAKADVTLKVTNGK